MSRVGLKRTMWLWLGGLVLVAGCGQCAGPKTPEKGKASEPAPGPGGPQVVPGTVEPGTVQQVPPTTTATTKSAAEFPQGTVSPPGAKGSAEQEGKKPARPVTMPRRSVPPEDK